MQIARLRLDISKTNCRSNNQAHLEVHNPMLKIPSDVCNRKQRAAPLLVAQSNPLRFLRLLHQLALQLLISRTNCSMHTPSPDHFLIGIQAKAKEVGFACCRMLETTSILRQTSHPLANIPTMHCGGGRLTWIPRSQIEVREVDDVIVLLLESNRIN